MNKGERTQICSSQSCCKKAESQLLKNRYQSNKANKKNLCKFYVLIDWLESK